MKSITQLIVKVIKRFLAFVLDINIVVFLFNIAVLLSVILFSNSYGDFMNFLKTVENDLGKFVFIYWWLLLGILTFYFVLIVKIAKNTIGLKLFGFKLESLDIRQQKLNVIDIFLKFITGFILDVLLWPINLWFIIKGRQVISTQISYLRITQTRLNLTNYLIGLLLVIVLSISNVYFYKNNLPFQLGKRYTNYEKLLNYAVKNQNAEMLDHFLQEYKKRTSRDLSFYECINSVLHKDINKTACDNVKAKLDSLQAYQKVEYYGYVGMYYFEKKDYKTASKYLKFFYDNKTFDQYYWSYVMSVWYSDTSLDKKQAIKVLEKHLEDLINSDNDLVIYKAAMLFMDKRKFVNVIKLLRVLKQRKPDTLDYADILWYLGEAQFLDKRYTDGLNNMEQAAKLNPTKYKTLYESYKTYYNTQIKK